MLRKIKEKKNDLLFGGSALVTTALMTSVPVFAETPEATDISSTLISSFTSTASHISTTLVGIIGIAMGLIGLKVAFKAGVSFFKSSATK